MCNPVIIHINSSFTILIKSTYKVDYEPERMKMSLNHTSEVFQMQNSDHRLLSCTGIAKTWGGGGREGKCQGLFDSYCLHR